MTVTVNIDIESARKILIMSAGSLEEANIYENMTDEEVKDKVLQHCKCWTLREVKSDKSEPDVELLDIVRCATRYLAGKSCEDMTDDNGEKHTSNEEDKELIAKYWDYYNKHEELKGRLKAEIDNNSQYEEVWDGHVIPESNVQESYETYVITVDRANEIIDRLL